MTSREPPNRLSVTQVTSPAPMGGLETVVASLASGLARRGHRVRVVALLGEKDRCLTFETLPGTGVELVPIHLPPRSYRTEIDRLTELLRATPSAVVHSHGYHADLIADRAARQAGLKRVSTAHGFVGGGWKNRLYEWLDCRALRRFDAVIAVSRPLVARLAASGVPPTRIRLMVNAAPAAAPLSRADARRRLDIDPGGLVCGWIGRLSREKGPDVFLEAVARLPDPWRASIVGSGPLGPELERQAVALGVAERVRWHGPVPEAGRLVAAFDGLVLSSRTEGTPMVAMEAMAARVPLIATTVGGVPDLVSAREAVLVEPEDPAELAAGIDRLRLDPDAAAERAASAAARLETEFAAAVWLDRHEALYRELAGSEERQ